MARNDYKEFDRYMTYILIGTGALFTLYLLFALLGVIWLKVILSILIFLICGGILAYLFLIAEIWRPRSRWMTLGAACTAFTLLISLITNCP